MTSIYSCDIIYRKEEVNIMKNVFNIKIKPEDLVLRNEMHFEVQRTSRAHVYKDRTKYSRKVKHKACFAF